MDTGLYYSLTVGSFPEKTFDVVEFNLDEALSELFELTIRVSTDIEHDIDLDGQLLQQAKFQIKIDGQVRRTINGVVEAATRDDGGFKRTYYTFTIRPKMWLLTLAKDSKIFHFKSVPDILDEILGKHGVKFSKQMMDSHASREYTAQKRETDYELFCRLASEEGIIFWFEEDQMFYSDSHLGMTKGQTLIYNPHPQSSTKEYVVYTLNYSSRMRSNEASLKDYRYSHPDVPLNFKEKKGKKPSFSVYDSYGRFEDEAMGKQFAKYRTEAMQAESLLGNAKSNCGELRPGIIFDIIEHPLGSMNKPWQIVRIRHHGTLDPSVTDEGNHQTKEDASILINEFEFVPGKIDWRPQFIHKPLADGDEVATVVGPAGEEIYVNADGAVKVHFHWNRYDAADENASCWVRVMQNWNGDGFGFLATPRIGQEVVISYLNGDIDRPIITGTVYNGNNRPPLDLPASKTKMTIKSKTHKGEGFNEMRFEDEAGKQEIYFHAQKDMNTEVLNDRSTHVMRDHSENVDNNQSMVIGVDQSLNVGNNQAGSIGNNQTLNVGVDQSETVGNNRDRNVGCNETITIGVDQSSTIGSNRTANIGSNRTITVGSNDTLTVMANQFETVAIAKTETIGAAKALSIGAAYQITVAAAMNTSVGLVQGTQVGLTKSLLVGKDYKQTISKDKTTMVTKDTKFKTGKDYVIDAGSSFTIKCGQSKLVMKKDGTITLSGKDLKVKTKANQSFKATGNIKLKGKKIHEN